MSSETYAYAVGTIKARERKLLNKNDLEQMLSQKDDELLISFLSNKGFGDSKDIKSIDELISYESSKLWDYLYSIVPEENFFDIFTIENDFHNFKAVLKGTIRGYDYEQLVIKPAKIDIKLMKTVVENKKFDMLPENMREACEKGFETLTQSKDVQLSDGIVDKGCMEAQIDMSKKTDSSMIKKYFAATVFYKNIKIALRGAKIKKNAEFFRNTMCEAEGLNLNELIKCATNSEQSVLEYVEKLRIYNSCEIIQSYEESPADFEKEVDDYLMSVIKEGKYITLGCEPIVSYLLARQREFSQIQLIAFGIRTQKSKDEIRRRLRTLYE